VAAPGLGFTLEGDGLAAVRIPVQLWSAANDKTVPYETNTAVVRNGLGPRAEFHSVAGASHMSFLVPCVLLGPPLLCGDQAGFDRKAFHAQMNKEVVRFFDRSLARPRPGPGQLASSLPPT
jgi:predicted dienelactone hydrolase